MVWYRCGKSDRTLRNCPLPYTPVLAYAPSRGKDGMVQKTLVSAAQESDGCVDFIETDQSATTPEVTSAGMENDANAPLTAEVSENSRNVQESAWISQWIDQVQDVEEIAAREVVHLGLPLSVLRTKNGSHVAFHISASDCQRGECICGRSCVGESMDEFGRH